MLKKKLELRKKIGSFLKTFIIAFLALIIIINLFIINNLNNKNSFFNKFSVAVVLSESMEPNLLKNDIIIIKEMEKYNIDDIVVYRKNNKLIVHRIIKINDDMVITKGDVNQKADSPIKISDIYGKVKIRIPLIGGIVSFLKSKYGLISIIVLIICLFIYYCLTESQKMKKK